MARRAIFVKKHTALVKARFAAAHHYFKAKDQEATAHRLRARWNNSWKAAIHAHEKAIAHHDFTDKQLDHAISAKLATIKHYNITVASLKTANVHRSAALLAWN
jgi:hypothetical protein